MLEAVAARQLGRTGSPISEPAACASCAVLVLLYQHRGDVHVVLTRRAPHLRRHAGEVAFPGGRSESCDVDLWATALREAAEETGLDPSGVRRVGRLDAFTTVTSRSRVHPFVASADRRPRLRPAPAEVDAVMHVRLGELLAEEAWREEVWMHRGGAERVMTFFELPGDTVWGATAAVLRQLLTIATSGAAAAR